MNTGLRLASSSALAASKRSCPTPWARRHMHTRKELQYKIENGLGSFMSPQTLQMVAVEYQQGLLDRLNEECRGKHSSRTRSTLTRTHTIDVEDKRKTVAQLVLDTARSQDRAVLFKYASHALNNSFFLNCLVSQTLRHRVPLQRFPSDPHRRTRAKSASTRATLAPPFRNNSVASIRCAPCFRPLSMAWQAPDTSGSSRTQSGTSHSCPPLHLAPFSSVQVLVPSGRSRNPSSESANPRRNHRRVRIRRGCRSRRRAMHPPRLHPFLAPPTSHHCWILRLRHGRSTPVCSPAPTTGHAHAPSMTLAPRRSLLTAHRIRATSPLLGSISIPCFASAYMNTVGCSITASGARRSTSKSFGRS